MSKIPPSVLSEAIADILTNAKTTKPRKFLEAIDLQVNLKGYDVNRDKRFSGSLRLPHVARPNLKVCIVCDLQHEEQAKKASLLTTNMEEMKKLNKNKKLVKKLCNQYDCFLASESIIKTIPRVVGPHMNRAGKFPTSVSPQDNLADKVQETQATVRFQLKKVLCLGCAVGHVKMTPDDVRQNTVLAINFLVSLLKKGWQNLKSVYLKSTMGASHRLL
jgi:large subunit ribosomal protein L10Ae